MSINRCHLETILCIKMPAAPDLLPRKWYILSDNDISNKYKFISDVRLVNNEIF